MNLVVPWAELVSLIAPHAPAPGAKGGRPPFAVETMLRIHFILYGPDAFCKPLLVMFIGLHTCIRLADGQSSMHARSLDEIRALRP